MCKPSTGFYRISVKREVGGVASPYLHVRVNVGDGAELLPPAGHIILHMNMRPLVLLTAGVGINPAISMLDAIAVSGRSAWMRISAYDLVG